MLPTPSPWLRREQQVLAVMIKRLSTYVCADTGAPLPRADSVAAIGIPAMIWASLWRSTGLTRSC